MKKPPTKVIPGVSQAAQNGGLAPVAFDLPPITEPISAPTTLQNLVEEYNSRAKLGEVEACSGLLQDALGYFARYYAAVCTAASRELDCLPGEVAQLWDGHPSVENAVPMLMACLERLGHNQERLARKLYGVFYEQDGEPRAFAHYCLPLGRPAPLVGFCCSPTLPSEDTIVSAARALDGWIAASFRFFLDSEHRLETGAYFGQLEQVVAFDQYTLRTGLTIRVRESRAGVNAAALVPSPVTGLALAAPVVNEVPTVAAEPAPVPAPPKPELKTKVAPRLEAEPQAGSPEAPAEAPIAIAPVVPTQAESLQKFVQTHRTSVPKNESEPKPDQTPNERPEIRLEPLGFVRSPSGKMGYGGYLWVSSRSGESIKGTAGATGGQVELVPSYFEGVSNRVVYWVHPDDVVSGREFIKITVNGEDRLYGLWKLAPPSRFENLTRPRQAGLLMLPAAIGCLYSTWVLSSSMSSVSRQLHSMLGPNYQRFVNPITPLSLRQAGIGQLDVSLKPQIESAVIIFLLVAWLVPVVVAKIYSRFPRRDQKPLVLLFVLGCCLPTLYFLLLWDTSLTQDSMTLHPELSQLDFRRNFLMFAVLNGMASLYEMISVEGLLHRFLNDLGRLTLPLVLAAVAAMLILFQVYGPSWFNLGV